MVRVSAMIIALMAGISGLTLIPTAHAEDPVVYEVWSATIPAANVEWSDTAGQHALQNVPLPWRRSVMAFNARSDDARLRATWQPGSISYPNAGRYMWVSLRIYSRGTLLCEVSLDVGESACTGRGYWADSQTPR